MTVHLEEIVEEIRKPLQPYIPPIWAFWRARRYVMAFMIFIGLVNFYALRINLSIGIVAMTQLNNVTLPNGTIILERPFDWDTKLQGYVLSSFFYGYVATQLFGGYLSLKFGGKLVFAAGIGIPSLLTLLSPLMANINVYMFLLIRILEGAFGGLIMPCHHTLVSKWYSPAERTWLISIGMTGLHVGTLIALCLSSQLASFLGWQSIFYVFGATGCIWTILWFIVISESPSDDPKISAHELVYITESLKSENQASFTQDVPWISMLTSKPVWAKVLATFCEGWANYTLTTELPKFMKYCLNFDLSQAGVLAALPYIAEVISLLVAGHLTDYMVSKNCFSLTTIRKIFTSGAFLVSSIFLILSAHTMSQILTVCCLIGAVAFAGISQCSLSVNSLDLAPKYGSLIVSIANTLGTIPGIISPILTGYLVTDETSVEEWRIVFYITAGVYLFGSIYYACFGSAKLQSWDNPENSSEIKETHQS